MQKGTIFIVVLVVFAGMGYLYSRNPAAYAKLWNDSASIFSSPDKVKETAVEPVVAVPTPTPVTPVHTTNQEAASPPQPDVPVKTWTPPTEIPAQPNWKWTTSDGKVYENVKVVKIEADCVTILHSHGGGRVPISTLPQDLQNLFNYDPDAAAKAAAIHDQEEAQAVAIESQFSHKLVNYGDALEEAKATGKLVLLHFTGSDWCPSCQYLDQEVFTQDSFRLFCASNFVVVTLDYPQHADLPVDLKQQNDSLGKKYNVFSYPTLLVADTDGKEIGRTIGYAIGSGPDPVIAALKPFCKH